MLCGLRRPAAGDKNGIVFPIRSARPKKMMIGTTSLLVLPETAIWFQVVDWARIGVTLVKLLDLLCHAKPPSAADFSADTRFRQSPLSCRQPRESILLYIELYFGKGDRIDLPFQNL
jgi:hypothetical protein